MEKRYFNIKEDDEQVVIEVYGKIGDSWWSEGVTFQGVSDQLKEIATGNKKVLVKINSYGGDVNDALAIYELLKGMGDRVTTECVGFCASAATIIAMAGAVRRMSSYGLFLVHKCSSWAAGNENDLEAELEAQRKVNDRIVTLYHDVTGCDREKLEALMNEDNGNGIWLNVDEAMEYGFITEAIKDTKEDTKKKAIVMSMFKKLFTNKNKEDMDAKQIQEFEDKISALEAKAAEAEAAKVEAENKLNEANTAKEAAETAKAEAENKLATAESEKAALEAKVAELTAIVDKTSTEKPPAGGSDTVETKDEFKDWYNDQDYVKDAKEALAK